MLTLTSKYKKNSWQYKRMGKNVSSLNEEELKEKRKTWELILPIFCHSHNPLLPSRFRGMCSLRRGPYRAISSFNGILASTSASSGDLALQAPLMDGYLFVIVCKYHNLCSLYRRYHSFQSNLAIYYICECIVIFGDLLYNFTIRLERKIQLN